MKKFAKMAILSVVSAVMVVAPLAGASAHDHHYWGGPGYWDGPRDWDRHHHHHNGHGDAVAAGAIGLAAGAILGSALSQPSQPQVIYQAPPPVYYPPAPRYYPPAPAAYKPVYQPWSPGWRNYCANKYRSFNPQTGTYRGIDGLNHFCNAN
ncbi:BA14K family protein [uncultured Bartonella sp.]|uniref:BA14K family protein n=1 Tax=uncultured Bartonella sp. TaxID=104108 RepID=UPI0026039341|nr:BA14K family protein [uncultured Bartonella sp.]